MDQFRSALGQYLVGSSDIGDLEAAIDVALSTQSDAAPQLVEMLDELYKGGRLPHQILAILKRRIASNQQPVRGADESPADATRLEMPTEQPAVRSDDDATRFQPVPAPDNMGPGGQTTGAGQTTGQGQVQPTGQPRGPRTATTGPGFTGQTGGTPSTDNWSHPSEWTGGGGTAGQTIGTGTVLKGQYVLEELIGQGGMGKVFKARDLIKEEAQDRNPYVAIKILNEDFKRHPRALQALQREASKAQNLAHPNIVFVGYFGRDGDNVFMQMELLEGEPLDELNKRHMRGLPVDDALPLIQGLAAGLSHAHKFGIVHSDFKPANAFLTRSGVIKIFDFGIARAAKSSTDLEGDKTMFDAGELGALTPTYASCEMIEGGDPDPRDDVYALAVVSYELMAGQHPFERKSAVKARDAGMVPRPIKGLTRRQWRAIRRGMAFDREARSPSVDAFMEELNPRSLVRLSVVGPAIAAVALITVVGLLGPGFLDGRAVDSLISTIDSGPDAAITARLDELRALRPDLQRDVLEATWDKLIGYYIGQIRVHWNPEAQALDYPAAEAKLQELYVFRPDSASVGDLRDLLEDERKEKIGALVKEANTLRDEGLLISRQAERSLVVVLDDMRRVAPDNELLERDWAVRFAAVAEATMRTGDLSLTLSIVEQGLQLDPEDVALANLRDAVSSRRAALERETRIAQLTSELEGVSGVPEGARQFAALRSNVRELARLDDNNPTLLRARQVVDQALRLELATLINAGAFDAGQEVLERYASFATDAFVTAQYDTLATAATDYFARVETIEAALGRAIAEDRLDGAGRNTAMAALDDLADLGVAQQKLVEARVQIAEAYVVRAAKARAQEQWDVARAAFRQGLALPLPDATIARLERELERMDQVETIALQAAEGDRQAVRAAQRQEEIRRLVADFNDRLAAPEFSVSAGRGALSVLDSLVEYDAGLEDGAQRLADRFAEEIDTLNRAADWEGALVLADSATAMLPDQRSVAVLAQGIRSENAARVAQLEKQRIINVIASIDGLMDDARLDQNWHQRVREQLSSYAGLVGQDDPGVLDRRTRIAGLYIADARRLRVEERFAVAGQQLDRAAELAPQAAGLATERNALQGQQIALQEQQRERGEQAEIDGLKLNLAAEANRGRVTAAKAILEELRAKIPDDPFVVREGPEKIAAAYLDLAHKQLDAGNVDDATKLADAAGALAANLPTLARLRGEIEAFSARPDSADQEQLAADLRSLESMQNAMAGDADLNTASIKGYLGEIRARSPELYEGFVPVMIGALIKKVEQLAGSDRSAAERRLNGARTIFPESLQLADYRLPEAAVRVAAKDPCANPGLIGKGSNRRASCRDALASNKRGPTLVVIPSGGPFAHAVAISKYEITIRDYNTYCELSGDCSARSGDQTLPVTGITVQQAQAFVSWLAEASGAQYRIPTSQEWEYAAHAGGQQPPRNFNCQVRQNNVLIKGMRLMPVNTGDANGWGLKHYVGNAQEWVRDGSGWKVRGGSYTNNLGQCDIGLSRSHSGKADQITGFRVLRELG